MIETILSRFHPRYVRSLVYMLQASEYDVSEYMAWFFRVKDFRTVEQRKHLEPTLKARVLLMCGWALWVAAIALAVLSAFFVAYPYGYVLGALFLFGSPFIVADGLGALVLLGKWLIQKPMEKRVAERTKMQLAEHKAFKIAIAGSFGKTTMREILKTVLTSGKTVAAPPGSYNTPLGIAQFVESLTGDEDVLVFELGEYYPGDVKKLAEIVQPDLGIITGVNEAHLKKFKSLEKTTATIFELADFLGDRPVYVNGESELARLAARDGHILYSRSGVGEWRVTGAHSNLSGTTFTFSDENESMQLSSKLLGLHQVGPLAVAAAVAHRLGLASEEIQKGVANTTAFEHRLEPHMDGEGVLTLDDSYNGNPDGVRAVIAFLSSLPGRRFYVTPGLVEMGEASEQVHREIGHQLAKAGIEKVVLIRNSVTQFIEEGLKEGGYTGDVVFFKDGPSAFAALPQMTTRGDIVLLQNDWPDQYA